MDRAPSPLLLNTYRLAAGLKIIGTLFAVALGYASIRTWVWGRWWMALTTGGVLLLILLPWERLRAAARSTITRAQLLLALMVGLAAPFLDLIQSSWHPYAPLLENPRFVDSLAWTFQEANSVHALGLLFLMVPVLLASWHYAIRGFLVSLTAAGVLYIVTPVFLPEDTFLWSIYYVRGFVLLGVTLILAFTVGTLAAAQRREQAQLAVLNGRLAAANERLAGANEELAVANRQLAEHAATLESLTISRERNRLARELHDTLAHALSGTAVQLQAVKTLLSVDPEAATAELRDAERQIRYGLEESRRAIAALRAEPLETLGLAAALRQRADQLGQRVGLAVSCEIGELPPLPPLVEQTVYRVADETLMNVEKHAAARRVSVALQSGDRLRLEIVDDGVGFEAEPAGAPLTSPDGHRFGLLGMRERAALVGGEVTIDTAPGAGTRVILCLNKTPFAS